MVSGDNTDPRIILPLPEEAPAGPMKILVATNFTAKSALALEWALTLSTHQAHGRRVEIYLFHSYDQRKTDFRRLDKINEDCVERMRRSVMDAIAAVGGRGVTHSVDTVHRRLSYGKPWLEILKVAGGISADMIIMGCPSSSAFRRLIEQAPCAMMLAKEKDATFIVD